MKLRSQLLLAFFLLAVIPLTGLVLSSYLSAKRTFERAVESEAAELAEEMKQHMEATKQGLAERIDRFGKGILWLPTGPEAELGREGDGFARRFLEEVGEAAPLVEGLEFVPAPGGEGEDPRARRRVLHLEHHLVMTEKALEEARAKAAEVAESGEGGEETGLVGGLRRHLAELPQIVEQLERRARDLEKAYRIEVEALEEEEGREQEQAGEPPGAVEPPAVPATAEPEAPAAPAPPAMTLSREPGREIDFTVRSGDRVIGRLKADVREETLIREALKRTRRDRGEIPFARDGSGQMYFASRADSEALDGVAFTLIDAPGESPGSPEAWVIGGQADSETGIELYVARPVGEALAEMRRSSARNLVYGLAFIALALVGMLPLSSRITRNLEALTHGADRLAKGDLAVRVPVRSRDEVGQLARAFNRMGQDLSEHQERLVDQERLRKEEEIERRLLAAENERKTSELEEARRFQLSMLPDELPEDAPVEIAVFTRTATEVGGDYYDFLPTDGGLTVAIGDATGHGARAGTLVAVVKGLFSSQGGRLTPCEFLADASATLKRMDLGRMAMAMCLARFEGRSMRVASAGMPPVLLLRAGTAEVEEITLPGMPLGGVAGFPYREAEVELSEGDTVLLMSDGFPEGLDRTGDPLGYEAVRAAFAATAGKEPGEVIQDLARAVESWSAGRPLADDVTFVALRAR